MANKRTKGKKAQGSVFLGWIHALCASLISLFSRSRIGRGFADLHLLYRNSLIGRMFEKSPAADRKKGRLYADSVIEQSRAFGALRSIGDFFALLGMNIYGMFFLAFALASVFIYYISMMFSDGNTHGISAAVLPVVIFICSIPMMVTSRSPVSVASDSRIMRGLLLSFLGVPEEKLKDNRQISGIEYMFISAIVGTLCGVLTYFVHPAYVPISFAVILVICLVLSNPESGVMMTMALAPFLQFFSGQDILLCAMVLLTAVSYTVKILRRKRTVNSSAESVLLAIFCGFILLAGVFSRGGGETLLESIKNVILIFGGFFLAYNLVRGQKKTASCLNIMTATFLVLCFGGLWNVFYNGIAEGVTYSFRENVQPIFESNILYIADNAAVFGVYSLLIIPMVFSYVSKRRSIKGIAGAVMLSIIAAVTLFVYGSYEALVGLAIEIIVFWMIYSHKSLAYMAMGAIPVAIFVMLYPVLSESFGWYDLETLIEGITPLPLEGSYTHTSTSLSIIDMLKDGNLAGIGAGKHAFLSYYPAYSDVVSLSALSPVSLWLQILCWSGVGGLICFSAFALFMFFNSIGKLTGIKEGSRRCDIAALLCGLFTVILFGFVSDVWSDSRMLWLFFTCAGLLAGALRDVAAENDRLQACFMSDSRGTDLELRF